ncbi:MAG: tetratricopeptide repeat protein [Treponema sp.]|nr:tetratricopeptide repeat protein [Treponema sp.]
MDNMLSQGIALYRQGAYSDALAFFLSLPDDVESDNIELAYFIGLCYAKLERFDDALVYLEQVVTAGKDLDRVLQCRFLLAVIYAKSGRRKLADFELNKLLETGYKPASVYAALAYIAWQQDDVDRCLALYKKSLDVDPDNPTALNGLGYVLACENRDLTQALTYCKRALDKAPQSPACLDSIGWVYLKLGLQRDAERYLLQAQSLLPGNQEISEHVRLLQETPV